MNSERFRRQIAEFQTPSNTRAAIELTITVVPLLFCWAATFFVAGAMPMMLLLMVPITSAFLVRSFMIFHDCAHYSFFRGRFLNQMTGRVLGMLAVTPYEHWRRTHALHHASAGNIDKRGYGDVPTLTVDEYISLSPRGRLAYRILRHPLVLFGLAPFYVFVIQPRLPVGLMRQGWKPWLSTLGTNFVVVIMFAILVHLLGWQASLLATIPVFAFSASIGVWLNFIQHNFEGSAYWSGDRWQFSEAAMHSSSNYVLPQPLRWFSADIGIHHIHHLNSRIPFYRLANVLAAYPDAAELGRVRVFDSFCISRTLWDQASNNFVSPRQAMHQLSVPASD